MEWSVEAILALVTLLVSIPTLIVAVFAIYRRCRLDMLSCYRGPRCTQTELPLCEPRAAISPSFPHPYLYAEPLHQTGKLEHYYAVHFGTVQVRGPVGQPSW
ncbi:hypothetical protein BJY01DRAFT_256541 [Aspergillus pseudoustus]|uniref:Uncharacterized protein n=1 Tax=Aspergillus pseudoustus TaxID=1810923 RepID=A0ABR4IAT8_9EURO